MNRTPLVHRLAGALLLLPLLAACGGAPGQQNAGGPALAPTAAPAQRPGATAAPAAEQRAAPTPAPAAAEPTVAAAAPPAGGSDVAVGAPAPAVGEAGAPLPPGTPVQKSDRPVGEQQPLKAGDIDDNDQFAAYLNYLRDYRDRPARQIDVSERYIFKVMDENQRGIHNARVRVYDGQQVVFEGLTYAGGLTIFHPRAAGVSANAQTLRVVAERDNAVGEATLTRGQGGETVEIGLRGQTVETPLKLDLLFLLDATGSMGDEIGQIQDTISSIAERIDTFSPRPELRFGLVAYKDEGDDYVTRVYDFTPDVGAFRQTLMQTHAAGGGDTPEALNDGLHQAVNGVQWDADSIRLVFLVADAPPHLDAQQRYDYPTVIQQAVAQGVKVYSVAASNTDPQAEYVMRQLAQGTLARFIFLTYQPGQSSGTPGESTPLEAGNSPEGYTVERLDDLVVQMVQRELAAAVGAV